MIAVTFAKLWNAHPANQGLNTPCQTEGRPNFENQCAIRMGIALKDGGVSLKSFKGARCWFGHGHILRAEELAGWLALQLSRPMKKKRTDATPFKGRCGIVLCRNFWGAGNQGDHIDLWNGSFFAHGNEVYFSLSEEVWFWAL